jgi:hypothetical protein
VDGSFTTVQYKGTNKYDLIGKLLWPSQEQVDKFTELAGMPPAPQVIFKSNTFYGRWRSIVDSKSPPSSLLQKDWTFLFASAVEAQTGHRKVVELWRNGKKIEFDSSHQPRVMKPSIELDSSHQPRVMKPSMGSVESSAVAGPSVTSDTTGSAESSDGAGPVVSAKKRKRTSSKNADPSLEDYGIKMVTVDVTPPPSYAAKAAKKKKEHSEYLLHVYKSLDQRLSLTKAEFNVIERSLHDEVIKLIQEGLEAPLVDWTTFGKDVGLVATVDLKSMHMVKEMISKFVIDGDVFRAWDKDDLFFPLSFRLPASLRDENHFTDDLLNMAIRKQNPTVLTDPEHFQFISTTIVVPEPTAKSSKGGAVSDHRLYKFRVDSSALDSIKKAGGRLQVIAARVQVFKGREPLCN